MTETLPPNQPMKYEARNLRCKHRRARAGGSIWLVEDEVERSVWDAFETVPEGAVLHHVVWWDYGDGPEPALTAASSGEQKKDVTLLGRYWEQMHKKGRLSGLPLLEVLDVNEPADVHDALCREFRVQSLNDVTPETFEAWAERKSLEYLVNISRNVWIEVQERHA